MSFLQLTMTQPPVSLEPLNLFLKHHCTVVVNVGSKPDVINMSPGTGRWGPTVECESEGGKWRCPREEGIAVLEEVRPALPQAGAVNLITL